MKIIIATHLYSPEIAEPAPYVEKISQALGRKHKIIVATYANVQNNASNVELLTVKKNQPLFWRLIKYTITLFRSAKNADLIYAQNGLAVGLPAIIVKYLTQRPLIIRFYQDEAYQRSREYNKHQSWLEFLTKPNKKLKIKFFCLAQKFILKKAEVIIVPSQFARQTLFKFYQINKEKIKVSHNPHSNLLKLPFDTQTQIGQIITFYFNNPNQIANIIKALEKIKENLLPPNPHLIVLEGKENPALKKIAQKCGAQISFLTNISQAEKQYLIQTSQAQIILPQQAIEEDIALVGLISQVPTIALAVGGLKEIINSQTGILLKTGQTSEIQKALTKIFANPDWAQKIGRQAKNDIEQKFSLSKHVNELEKIFTRG